MEIERKFLVKGSFKEAAFKADRIAQGYLCRTGCTVRVRIRGEKGYLTIKGPSIDGGISRYEWEKEIPHAEALELMTLCQKGIIDKTRYLIKNTDGIHTWEVDEFHGDNEGLVLAEIELSSPDEAFDRPSWLGEEVTGDRRYYNSMLSQAPINKK